MSNFSKEDSPKQSGAASSAPKAGRGPITTRHLLHHEPPIFEIGAPGRNGASLPASDVPEVDPTALYGALGRKQAAGLPEAILAEFSPETRLMLPMRPGNRSLNVSNAVAVVIYEAWRQQGFR